jgi:hypothetical protein
MLGTLDRVSLGILRGMGLAGALTADGRMRLFAKRRPIGIGWVARVGPVIVGIGPLGEIRFADRTVEGVVRVPRYVLCAHTVESSPVPGRQTRFSPCVRSRAGG